MRLTRTAIALTLSAAVLAFGSAAPANAVPNPGVSDDLFTIRLVVADPTAPTTLCNISFTPTSSVTFLSTGIANGSASESGRLRVSSSGCRSVSWTSVVIVKDEALGHPTRSVVGAGGTSAQAFQNVPYSLGLREAGLVTVTMIASSRLGDFCWEDVWQVAATGNPAPIRSGIC